MSDLDELRDTILQITEEINTLDPGVPMRLPGDVDHFQLMRAWGQGESAVRRKMKLVGENPGKTGFELIRVYDPDRHHAVVVLRKVTQPVSE